MYCRYYFDLCVNVFGNGIYLEVDIINFYYGGFGIIGIVFLIFISCVYFDVIRCLFVFYY